MNFITTHFYIILPLLILDGTLKLISLWKSSQNKQLYWFIALGIINSAGILPILYLLFFQNKTKK